MQWYATSIVSVFASDDDAAFDARSSTALADRVSWPSCAAFASAEPPTIWRPYGP
jgi:hypothetical protein